MSAYIKLVTLGPALTPQAASNKAVILYKAIVRQLPIILSSYQINLPLEDAKRIVKNKFYANANIQDPRVAETLVYRGAMRLDELVNHYLHEDQARSCFESEPEQSSDYAESKKSDDYDQLLSSLGDTL